LGDGDRLVLHDDQPSNSSQVRRAVMLIHGLAGCHGSGYMMRIADKLCRAGFRVFRLDLRGCGAGAELARQSLHAGRVDDVLAGAQFIQQLCPGTPLTLVGFSLGASMLLKLLGSHRPLPASIDSSIAVAPPLDLAACSRNLSRGWNRMYDRSFVRMLSRCVDLRRRRVPDFVDRDGTRRPTSLYEFDASFTAPLGGFDDVEDYYHRCSSLHDLPRIRVATRILFAKDDPLVPADVFSQAVFSPTTRVYATDNGGHLGFLALWGGRSLDADWHWMDWRIVDWVRESVA
jgi:predicted alpha/beta-fold hydrolase